MSYDLVVFETSKAPTVHAEFLKWLSTQTRWGEKRDYYSIAGTQPRLVAWFMDIKERFPPLNGEYSLSDEEAFASIETEKRLTDYSIGSDIIYAAVGWSVAEEADKLMAQLAKRHAVGFYNPQTGETVADGMVFCKLRTERYDDKLAVWEQIERELQSLDAPERGISHRDNAFITVFFAGNGTDEEFMQCMPNYPKPQGLFKKIFGTAERAPITGYTVEAGNGEKIYEKQVAGKEALWEILRAYYETRKLPDISDWTDTHVL